MLLAADHPRPLGSASPRLQVGRVQDPGGPWEGKRALMLDNHPAFELAYWCGTCPLLFDRQDHASKTLSIDALETKLTEGLSTFDGDVLDAFGALLPVGDYLPMLLEITPKLVSPSGPGDYFVGEQLRTWGANAATGQPESPHTSYYRTFEAVVDRKAHLFEFVVPMVPPSWNDEAWVFRHRERLQVSSRPTTVAVSFLDISMPATQGGFETPYAHWGLTHFLLDGHHKMQAAAELGQPLRLLSLLSVQGSLADEDDVMRVPQFRMRPRKPRPAPKTWSSHP